MLTTSSSRFPCRLGHPDVREGAQPLPPSRPVGCTVTRQPQQTLRAGTLFRGRGDSCCCPSHLPIFCLQRAPRSVAPILFQGVGSQCSCSHPSSTNYMTLDQRLAFSEPQFPHKCQEKLCLFSLQLRPQHLTHTTHSRCSRNKISGMNVIVKSQDFMPDWVQIPVLPSTGFVNLGKSLYFLCSVSVSGKTGFILVSQDCYTR